MDKFRQYLPLLQSLIDCKIASVTLEANMYSLNNCEILMTLFLQTIITFVDENKNSPEKLELITAILIATRVDEVVNTLGNMGKLNQLVGANVKILKGGSYFKEMMGGGFSKTNKQSKQTKKTQKGGAGCNEQCAASSDCTSADCSECINGTCKPSAQLVSMPSNSNSAITQPNASPGILAFGGQPIIPYNVNSPDFAKIVESQMSYAVVQDSNKALLANTAQTHNMRLGILNESQKQIQQLYQASQDASRELSELLASRDKEYDNDFNKILEENRKALASLENVEMGSAVTGASLSGYSAYAFVDTTLKGLAAISGGIGSFVFWLLLSAQTLVNKTPFAYVVGQMFDNECYGKNPFGQIWPVYVKTTESQELYSYDWYNPVTGVQQHYTSQSTCPDRVYDPTKWGSWGRMGECKQGISTVMATQCQYFPDLLNIQNLFTADRLIVLVIVCVLLGGFFSLYLSKIVTLQTKITRKLTFFNTIGRGVQYATGVGAVVDILTPSQQRSELIFMVKNQQIQNPDATIESNVKFLTKEAYKEQQAEKFKKTNIYIKASRKEETTLESYNKIISMSTDLTSQILQSTSQVENATTLAIQNVATAALQGPQQNPQIQNPQGQGLIGNSGGKRLKSKTRKYKKRGTRKNKKYSHKRR